jgi:hypothetical protein
MIASVLLRAHEGAALAGYVRRGINADLQPCSPFGDGREDVITRRATGIIKATCRLIGLLYAARVAGSL